MVNIGRVLSLLLLLLGSGLVPAWGDGGSTPITTDTTGSFDNAGALQYSQSAIGRTLGEYTLTDVDGRPVPLTRYRGRPLVVSLVYTSCYHTCPMTTRYLLKAVRNARQVLGPRSFTVLTIGFDTRLDTPFAMRNFAKLQGVDLENWEFLSADARTMESLVKDLGFLYTPSPKGYEHLIQATVVDGTGIVRLQVYGDLFPIPQLVEPLKQMVLGTGVAQNALDRLWTKVRLFCTTYDPSGDRYAIDYSLFIGMAIGASILIFGIAFLVNEIRRGRKGYH
ncbi:protein SCO1 [Gammaproteobacteria bacterium]